MAVMGGGHLPRGGCQGATWLRRPCARTSCMHVMHAVVLTVHMCCALDALCADTPQVHINRQPWVRGDHHDIQVGSGGGMRWGIALDCS